ncbi:MAG TPA: 4Fe-4S dicluster domain-containing protein [Anaerolineales bacterium]
MVMKQRYGFVIDISRCIDCRACLVACSVENNVPMDHTRIWVKDLGVQGKFPDLQRAFVPYNCMHCENPPCVDVCVSGATYKDADTGLVMVDQDACIGCGFCVDACPYDARYLDEVRGVVDKCNGCIQRVEAGGQPACVATCIGNSRLFGDLNDPDSGVSIALKNAKTVQRLDYEKEGHDTDPNIYYINGDVLQSSILPRDPRYNLEETGWKKVLVPAIFTGIGASFLVQATYFTKQLVEGESEFEK